MKYIIDRIEQEYIVLEAEDGKHYNIPLALLPTAQDGDVIEILIDKELTITREERIQTLFDSLTK